MTKYFDCKPKTEWKPSLRQLWAKVLPELKPLDVCGIQPMSAPAGLIFSFKRPEETEKQKVDREIREAAQKRKEQNQRDLGWETDTERSKRKQREYNTLVREAAKHGIIID